MYILTIILLVGSIVVVGNVKSQVTSTGVDTSTHPISLLPEFTAGAIVVPDEFANCI